MRKLVVAIFCLTFLAGCDDVFRGGDGFYRCDIFITEDSARKFLSNLGEEHRHKLVDLKQFDGWMIRVIYDKYAVAVLSGGPHNKMETIFIAPEKEIYAILKERYELFHFRQFKKLRYDLLRTSIGFRQASQGDTLSVTDILKYDGKKIEEIYESGCVILVDDQFLRLEEEVFKLISKNSDHVIDCAMIINGLIKNREKDHNREDCLQDLLAKYKELTEGQNK